MTPEANNGSSSVEAAKQKALSLLDRRDYSRAELLRKLSDAVLYQ